MSKLKNDDEWIASFHEQEKKTFAFYTEKERQLVANVNLEEKKDTYVEEHKRVAKKVAAPRFNEEEKQLVTNVALVERKPFTHWMR